VCLLFFPLYILWLCYMGLWQVICFACQHAPCFTALVVLFGGVAFFGGWCFFAGVALRSCLYCMGLCVCTVQDICPLARHTPHVLMYVVSATWLLHDTHGVWGFHGKSFLGQYPVAFLQKLSRGGGFFFLFRPPESDTSLRFSRELERKNIKI